MIEPIKIYNEYEFKSFRYSDKELYIKLSESDKQQLRETFRKLYPQSAPSQYVIQIYIQNMSCGFCLKFGHWCCESIYPSACPNIPPSYIKIIEELSIKYKTNPQYINYLLMTGVGSLELNSNNDIPQWSWEYFIEQFDLLQNGIGHLIDS